ncbi:MAG TPA: hypothetical protein ENN13_02540 [Candidatus Altiarchaeales archaeon]|nr:hypothetical protein [Candidatus Altiarchaeales archaeon]
MISRRTSIFLALLSYLLVLNVVNASSTNPIVSTVCDVLCVVLTALDTIGGTLVIIMFLYGGLTYVYSADNPGGRKKGRDICVHSLIGGILIVLAGHALGWVGLSSNCICDT